LAVGPSSTAPRLVRHPLAEVTVPSHPPSWNAQRVPHSPSQYRRAVRRRFPQHAVRVAPTEAISRSPVFPLPLIGCKHSHSARAGRLRSEDAWRPRHFPARNGWDQCRKVRLYDSSKLSKSKERPQPGYHLSSPTTSMSRRMASDERPNVRDANGPEINWAASELLGEEPVNMPRVVVDRCTI
jgi:hypothetical protein